MEGISVFFNDGTPGREHVLGQAPFPRKVGWKKLYLMGKKRKLKVG